MLKSLQVVLLAIAISTSSVQAKEFSLGTTSGSKLIDASILVNPTPEIPSEYKAEAVKTSCVAKFHIEKDGKFEVKLLDTTGNDEIDHIVLATLKKWKFKPATLDEEPVKSTKKLRVELEID